MRRACFLLAVALYTGPSWCQITNDRLLHADSEPQNWLTYSGSYKGWRYSKLDQINRQNAKDLKLAWVYQMTVTHRVETTPLVVDGVMYLTEPPSNVVAIDAATGRPFWRYHRSLPSKINVCCGQVNRGVAILGDRLFVGTVDAHLVALNAKTGAVLWDTEVADYRSGYSVTVAPLIVKDMVISGIAGGEWRHSRLSRRSTTSRPANAAGVSGPFPAPAKKATNPGPATPGCTAADQPGSPAPTTQS